MWVRQRGRQYATGQVNLAESDHSNLLKIKYRYYVLNLFSKFNRKQCILDRGITILFALTVYFADNKIKIKIKFGARRKHRRLVYFSQEIVRAGLN